MSERPSAEAILGLARKREEECDWVRAVESYKKALGLVPETDSLRVGGDLGENWLRVLSDSHAG